MWNHCENNRKHHKTMASKFKVKESCQNQFYLHSRNQNSCTTKQESVNKIISAPKNTRIVRKTIGSAFKDDRILAQAIGIIAKATVAIFKNATAMRKAIINALRNATIIKQQQYMPSGIQDHCKNKRNHYEKATISAFQDRRII